MKISPSFLTCDFTNLINELNEIKDEVEYIHIDVMDGVFVPNLTFGPKLIKDLRSHFSNIFDVHLMIIDPIKYIKDFAEAGSDIITFHYESNSDVLETIKEIKSYNKKVGISIKPNTKVDEIKKYLNLVDLVLVMSVEPGFGGQKFMLSAVDKIEELYNLRRDNNYSYEIEVDGGINENTIELVKEKNIDVVVAGSFIMNSDNKKGKIELLRNK